MFRVTPNLKSKIQNLNKFGKIGINLRLSKILNYQLGNLPTGDILKDQRVVIAVDGGRTKIRINKEGNKNPSILDFGF